MKVGFAKIKITPPIGTTMIGFFVRDRDHGCERIHDDLFVRALYLEHENVKVLIMGFDLCFLGRDDADRYKGAIGRKIDFSPRQILFNTSHTHAGPSVGRWAFADYTPPDRLYLDELEQKTVTAACQAQDAAVDVTMWAGTTSTSLPMNRRKKSVDGSIVFAPSPDGVVYDSLPICLFKDLAGKPVSLLFSVSCHASTVGGWEISADYPGVAMDQLDAYLGSGASLFLQGAGGDTKPAVIGNSTKDWRRGNWEDVEQAGTIAAQKVIQAMETGLVQIEPEICTHLIDMSFPLAPSLSRSSFEELLENPETDELKRLWAKRQIERLDRDQKLPASVPITCHGVQLGKGLRLIGLEGEPVAELGLLIQNFYNKGITLPLGYTNGAQLYLPTSEMLEEGGYEVESYFEYGFPAPLAEGLENILTKTLRQMRDYGIG